MLYGGRPDGDTSPLKTQKNVLPFLSSCAAIAPTFMSLGNHEWIVDGTDLAALAATGVTLLDNSWIERDGLVIAGLTSGYVTDYRTFRAESNGTARYPRQESISGIGGAIAASRHKPDLSWFSAFAAQPGYKIALSHHPEYWPLLKDENIDLILSGHAHGGQIRMYNPIKRE